MCAACDMLAFIDKLDAMINGGRFHWCYDFLRDVRNTVMATRHATPKQKAAIEKIQKARKR